MIFRRQSRKKQKNGDRRQNGGNGQNGSREGQPSVRNAITLRIQPDESIILSFDAKRPGPQINVEQVSMEFSYSKAFGANLAEAYERLLLDAMLGDSTLFIRRDETELAWDRVTNVLEGWQVQEDVLRKRGKQLQLPQYEAGSWGPLESDDLLARSGHYWRNV